MRLPTILLATMAPLAAEAAERQPVAVELVLALDCSASVNQQEFELQIEGLARAFQHPDVIAAVDSLRPLGAAIAVVQWGSPGETRVVVPFTHVENGRDAKAFGFLVGLTRRWMRASSTSIATAIGDSRLLLEANDFEGGRVVIDVSGDGRDNGKADLDTARQGAKRAKITVNGLAIENEDSSLGQYYEERVITGSGAFVERARDYQDFARAIREKLTKELRPLGS